MLNRIGKKLGYKDGGFTIIEVMIVLAVAGLIMAIVLVAIPQLQRSQRNSARKNVVDRIKIEYENYAANNNGQYPHNKGASPGFDLSGFATRYLSGVEIKNPSTNGNYALANPTSTIPTDGTVTLAATSDSIGLYTGASCNGEVIQTSAGGRNYAFVVGLEGGSNAVYCVDNN